MIRSVFGFCAQPSNQAANQGGELWSAPWWGGRVLIRRGCVAFKGALPSLVGLPEQSQSFYSLMPERLFVLQMITARGISGQARNNSPCLKISSRDILPRPQCPLLSIDGTTQSGVCLKVGAFNTPCERWLFPDLSTIIVINRIPKGYKKSSIAIRF